MPVGKVFHFPLSSTMHGLCNDKKACVALCICCILFQLTHGWACHVQYVRHFSVFWKKWPISLPSHVFATICVPRDEYPKTCTQEFGLGLYSKACKSLLACVFNQQCCHMIVPARWCARSVHAERSEKYCACADVLTLAVAVATTLFGIFQIQL